jgi:hypothetical protein
MVRVFVPAAAGDTPFAGVVEHVGTNWSAQFANEDELLRSIRTWLDREQAVGTSVTAGRRQGGST